MSEELSLTTTQQKIVDSPSSNMLISAGAGSGKTFVLTQRVIHLLKDKGYKLKEMIILTFTDLAAQEMKTRIIKELKKESRQETKYELEHIDEASIQTFDSFCRSFITKYSCYSTMPKTFEIGDKNMFKMVADGILKDILTPYFENPVPAFNEFIDIFVKKESDIYEYFFDLYDKITNIVDYEDYIKNYIQYFYSPEFLVSIKDRYLTIAKEKSSFILQIEVPDYLDKVTKYVNEIKESLKEIIESDSLSFVISELKKCKDKSIPQVKMKDEDKKEELRERFEFFRNARRELCKLFEYQNELEILEGHLAKKSISSFIMTVIEELDIKLKEFKKDHSVYTFLDIEKEAIRILRTHEDVRQYYKTHIKEILIDEYQDTNDIQNEMISYIKNDNVIVVGDIKQCIYRFRGANPEIFRGIYNDYKDNSTGKVIELYDNFRSRKEEVLDIVNNTFTNIKSYPQVNMKYLDQNMGYGNTKYDNFNQPTNKFKIFSIDPKNDNEYDIIARDIYDRINNGQMVYDTKTGEKRKAEPKDFMILSAQSKYFKDMAQALKNYHIQSKIFNTRDFIKTKEIVFLKNILKLTYLFENELFEDPEFNLTLLSIVRSFVMGVKGDIIVDYLDRTKYQSNISAMIALFRDLYDKMCYLVQTLHRYNMYYVLKEAIKIFNVYEKLMVLDDYEEKELKISHILDAVKTLANSKMGIKDAIKYFDYLKSSDNDLDIKQNDLDALNYVSIMTIHKSKGLERPFVYYLRTHESFKDTIDNFKKDFGIYYKTDKSLDKLYQTLELAEVRREKIRLLYVALTRPKESLTLVFDENTTEYIGELNDAKTYQKLLLMNNDFSKYYVKPSNTKNIIIQKDPDIAYTNHVNYHIFNTKKKELVNKTRASHELYTQDEEVFKVLERGTEVHSYFELVNFTSDIEPQMEKYQIPVQDKDLLRSFKSLDIFNKPIIKEYHELPYFTESSKGIIDYLIEYEDSFYIIDFKLKNIDDPLYVTQLKTYKDYLKTRTNKPIETYLYSIMDRELRKIDTI